MYSFICVCIYIIPNKESRREMGCPFFPLENSSPEVEWRIRHAFISWQPFCTQQGAAQAQARTPRVHHVSHAQSHAPCPGGDGEGGQTVATDTHGTSSCFICPVIYLPSFLLYGWMTTTHVQSRYYTVVLRNSFINSMYLSLKIRLIYMSCMDITMCKLREPC